MRYVVTHNFTNINQHGFVPNRSTCFQLLETRHDWCSGLDNRDIFDAITIYFRKALDVVQHTESISKLSSL